MLFTPTDFIGKISPFLTIKFIQTQIVKHCRTFNAFFLTYLHANKLAKSIHLSSYCHNKAANQIVR